MMIRDSGLLFWATLFLCYMLRCYDLFIFFHFWVRSHFMRTAVSVVINHLT